MKIEQIGGNGREREEIEKLLFICAPVLPQNIQHLRAILPPHHNIRPIVSEGGPSWWGARSFCIIADPPPFGEKVEEAVGRVGIVTGVRKEGELTVEEDYSVSKTEEVFGGGCATGPSAEVVDEANSLVFEGNHSAAGGDEDDAIIEVSVVGEEGVKIRRDLGEVGGRSMGFKVDVGIIFGGRGGHGE